MLTRWHALDKQMILDNRPIEILEKRTFQTVRTIRAGPACIVVRHK